MSAPTKARPVPIPIPSDRRGRVSTDVTARYACEDRMVTWTYVRGVGYTGHVWVHPFGVTKPRWKHELLTVSIHCGGRAVVEMVGGAKPADVRAGVDALPYLIRDVTQSGEAQRCMSAAYRALVRIEVQR